MRRNIENQYCRAGPRALPSQLRENVKYKQVICSPFLHLKIRPELGGSGIASCYSAGLFCIDSLAMGTAKVLQRERGNGAQ